MQALLRFLLSRLWLVLSLLVGLMQAVVLAWLEFLLLTDSRVGTLAWLGIAVLLAVLNVWLVPLLGALRGRGGAWRRLSGIYMGLAAAVMLAGGVVLASWLGSFLVRVGSWGEASDLFRSASIVAVLALVATLFWGFSGGQQRIATTRQRLALTGLRPGSQALRVVQISDLHIGNGFEGTRLARAVDRINALQPDLIVITGDLFDFDPIENEASALPLARLEAPLGIFAVLGNHDFHAGFESVARAIADAAPNVRLLRDEIVRVATPGPFYLAGIDDPGCDWAARDIEVGTLAELAEGLPRDGPTLLLVHRPEVFPQAARLGFPLVLAGHTHGGQVALPGPGVHLNPARLISRFDRGIYHEQAATLYVNRGLGVAGPAFRLNCPREITVLELTPG